MWQGAHMGQLRMLTGKLFLSAYHGTHVMKTLSQTDLSSCVTGDVRSSIGEAIFKKEVWYPEENPSPLPAERNIEDLSYERLKELVLRYIGK